MGLIPQFQLEVKMAILFADSYDHYQTAGLIQKYASVASGNTIVPSVGQCASQALQQVQTAATTGVMPKLQVAPSGATVNVMVAVNAPVISGGIDFFNVYNGGTPVFRAFINNDGSVSATRNPDAAFPPVVFTSPGGLIPHNILTFVGMQVVLSNNDTTGSVTLQVNGTSVYSLPNINTSFDGPVWSNVALGGKASSSRTVIFDSFILGDGTGSAPQNSLLGQAQVEWIAATAPGNNTDWTVTGAAANWNVSDNNSPSPSTKYVSSGAVNALDLYEYGNVPIISSASIYGVQISILAALVSAGTRDIQAVIRQSGTTTPSGINVGVPVTDFAYLITMLQNNPQTSAAWTLTEVNADQYGGVLSV